MNKKINNICIFASASNNIDEKYHKDAIELGKLIAKNNYNVVYGGSNLGLMGKVTNSAKSKGSKIIGVMPEKLYNLGIHPGDCDKLIITKGMRERKAKMDELSDAVITLAGGFGTLEEISEMLTQKQLGYNNKPIVFLNTLNFYDELISFFYRLIGEKFAQSESTNIYYVAKTPSDAINYINNYDFKEYNYLDKKICIKNQSNV